jgi:DNA replication protein DnaC
MNTTTLEKLRKLKFTGMYNAFKANLENGKAEEYTADQMLALLVDAEYDYRMNKRIESLIFNARFRYKASIEEMNYHPERNIDRNFVQRLADCTFITRSENILITGSTGCGKSYLATALGINACEKGYRTLYMSITKLFPKLKMAKADGTYIKEIAKIERMNLVIFDDFGIHPLDAQSRAILMEVIEDIHGKTSMIFTSQLPVNKWFEVIGERTIADAVLDRVTPEAHRIEIEGESMRKRRSRKSEYEYD